MPVKPSSKEEEFIARLEFEEKKKREEERTKRLLAEEKKKMQELHFMRCPKCGMELIEIAYKKLKIDKCSSCEGIWLDAGEFEEVTEMEKSSLDKFFQVFKK
jgi:uncharacterized protein